MATPYQDFVKKARERFEKRKAHTGGRYQFTEHSRFKMKQYNLSEQRVTRIIRAPKRTEEGIATRTIAVMQPGTLVGANSFVNKDTEPWTVYVGSPAKPLKERRRDVILAYAKELGYLSEPKST
jgi:hypothetical protein